MAHGYGNEMKEGRVDGYQQRGPQPPGPRGRTAMEVQDESEIYPMSCLLVVQVYGEGGGWAARIAS